MRMLIATEDPDYPDSLPLLFAPKENRGTRLRERMIKFDNDLA
jgi:hypothetical protein